MELLIGLVLFAVLFLGGLLLSDYAYRAGGTMEERRAVVFEVYRYAICFIMVIVFGLLAFQVLSGLAAQMIQTGGIPDLTQVAGLGIGALIVAMLFLIHWLMKNPALPKDAPPPPQG